jgi:hypothetical protein
MPDELDPPAYDPPERYTWAYIDNLRARAIEWRTIDHSNVVRLLAKLEAGALLRHGPRPEGEPAKEGSGQ